MALAIEQCNLHMRIGLLVLKLIGTSQRLLLLGFMVPTGLMSMWISNTSSTALMIPIVEAALEIFDQEEQRQKGGKYSVAVILYQAIMNGIDNSN